MKTLRLAAMTVVALALVLGGVAAAERLKSGPQVGDKVPGPFHPLNVTGADAGTKTCLYCKHGDAPVAVVFARGNSEPVAKLLKQLDGCTAKNSECGMGSFAVFLTDEEGMEKELKALASKSGLKHTVLAIDNKTGPEKYNIAKDAEVTVVLYTDHTVKANYAFKKGEFKNADVEKIVADVAKITPAK